MTPPPTVAEGQLLAGDCLDVVPTLAPDHPFDLVYMDPPFNAGGTRSARGQRGQRVDGEAAYRDAWGGLDGFLSMLAPRLEVIVTRLAVDGSLWLHLDHRAVHDAKVLVDGLVGRPAFQGEIIWTPGNGARRRTGPAVTHQTILIYCQGHLTWNADDRALREPYAATSQRMHFRQEDAAGRRYRERRIGGKTYRYYADEGRLRGSVWTDLPAMRANTPILGEATGYPTQKPEALLERILRAATRPGDRVLDPMCGSGTTLAVAQRLGRAWTGIDQSPVALTIARERLANAGADIPDVLL